MPALPQRIDTPRLVVRCWNPRDAAALKAAVDASLSTLQRWLPWAMHEPSPLEAIAARLAGFEEKFLGDSDWAFGIWSRRTGRLLGGAGLHPRRGPGALELGYWLRDDAVGRGIISEAATALVRAALDVARIERVEIRSDPQNVRSTSVARRLGFRLAGVLPLEAVTPAGQSRDTEVWEMTRPEAIRLPG